MINLIFVYGTLRKHAKNHSLIQNEKLIASQAWATGELYDSEKGYPFFICEGTSRVYGEVYELSSDKFSKIDELASEQNHYTRVEIAVHTDHLGDIEVYTYVNKKEQVTGSSPLRYGDWLVHLELDRDWHTYYAYGSCMDSARFKLAQVDHLFLDRIGGGTMDRLEMNYSLSVHDGGRANIIETGNQGEGVLYKVGRKAIQYLFKREGVDNGLYRPAIIDVTVNGRIYEKSLTFIVLNPIDECAPPMHYATEIIRGARGVVSEMYHQKLIKDLKEKYNMHVAGDE